MDLTTGHEIFLPRDASWRRPCGPNKERGGTLIEASLVLVLIALIAVPSLYFVGAESGDGFCKVHGSFESKGAAAADSGQLAYYYLPDEKKMECINPSLCGHLPPGSECNPDTNNPG